MNDLTFIKVPTEIVPGQDIGSIKGKLIGQTRKSYNGRLLPYNSKVNGYIMTGNGNVERNGNPVYDKFLVVMDFDGTHDFQPNDLGLLFGKTPLKRTYSVKTGSGGLHIYYSVNGFVSGSQGYAFKPEIIEMIPNIDALDIRADNGLVYCNGTDFTSYPGNEKKGKAAHKYPYATILDVPIVELSIEEWNEMLFSIVDLDNKSVHSTAMESKEALEEYEKEFKSLNAPKKVNAKKGEKKKKKKIIIEIPNQENIDLDSLSGILLGNKIKQGVRAIYSGDLEIAHGHGILFKGELLHSSVKEFNYWKSVVRAGMFCGLSYDTCGRLLSLTQPEFDADEFSGQRNNVGEPSKMSYNTHAKFFKEYTAIVGIERPKQDSEKKLKNRIYLIRKLLETTNYLEDFVFNISDSCFYYYDSKTKIYKLDDANVEIQYVADKMMMEVYGDDCPIYPPSKLVPEMKHLLRRQDRVVSREDFKQGKNFIACANCVLEFKKGVAEPIVHEYSRDIIVTNKIQRNYLPIKEYNHPNYDFIASRYPTQTKMLERYIANIIRGVNYDALMFFLVGRGGTGKGTVSSVFEKMLAGVVSATTLADFKSDFNYGALLGRRLNVIHELPSTILTEKATTNLKSLSGDAGAQRVINIKFEKKRNEIIDDIAFVSDSNGLPQLKGSQDGWGRRIRVLVMDKKFETRDVEIKDSIDDDEMDILFTRLCNIGLYKFNTSEDTLFDDFKTVLEREKYHESLWYEWSHPVEYALDRIFTKLKVGSYPTNAYGVHIGPQRQSGDGMSVPQMQDYIEGYLAKRGVKLRSSNIEKIIKVWCGQRKDFKYVKHQNSSNDPEVIGIQLLGFPEMYLDLRQNEDDDDVKLRKMQEELGFVLPTAEDLQVDDISVLNTQSDDEYYEALAEKAMAEGY